MKIAWLVIAVAACSARAPLADDVAMFCGAWEANGRPARIGAMAEYIASRIKTAEMRDVFAGIGPEDDSWPQLFKSLHSMVDRVGVTSCPTLEWMEKTYVPGLRPVAATTHELVLTLSAAGVMTTTDRGAAPTELAGADLAVWLRAAVMRDPDIALSVIAEPAVTFERVLAIRDAAKSEGLERFAFGTEAAHLVPFTFQQATAGAQPTANLVVEFSASGEVFVAGNLVADSDLDAVFRAAAARDRKTGFVAVADASVPVGNMVAVLVRAQNAGLTVYALGPKDIRQTRQLPKKRP